jgi:hypothetical protein
VQAVSFWGTDDMLTTVVAEGQNLRLFRIGAQTNRVQATYHGEKQRPGIQSLGCSANSPITLLGAQGGVLLAVAIRLMATTRSRMRAADFCGTRRSEPGAVLRTLTNSFLMVNFQRSKRDPKRDAAA